MFSCLFVAAMVWSNAPGRVSLASETPVHLRMRYRFNVADADALDVRFNRSQRGTAYDAVVISENGARMAVVDGARMAADRVLIEWSVPNVRAVEVTVHAHGRKLHLADFWVGKRGRS